MFGEMKNDDFNSRIRTSVNAISAPTSGLIVLALMVLVFDTGFLNLVFAHATIECGPPDRPTTLSQKAS